MRMWKREVQKGEMWISNRKRKKFLLTGMWQREVDKKGIMLVRNSQTQQVIRNPVQSWVWKT